MAGLRNTRAMVQINVEVAAPPTEEFVAVRVAVAAREADAVGELVPLERPVAPQALQVVHVGLQRKEGGGHHFPNIKYWLGVPLRGYI